MRERKRERNQQGEYQRYHKYKIEFGLNVYNDGLNSITLT